MKVKGFSLYRFGSLFLISLDTLLASALLCGIHHLPMDQWLGVFFIDTAFLLVFYFQLEYERTHGYLQNNTETSFLWLSMGYGICCIMMVVFTLLPEFFQPVILIPVIMCAFSNEIIALVTGLLFCILLSLIGGESQYSFICYVFMMLISTILCKTLKEKKYRLYVSFLYFCIPLVVSSIFYYWANGTIRPVVYLYGLGCGIVTAVMVYWLYDHLRIETEQRVERQYENIIGENYPRVQELRAYSISEYEHARQVSRVAGKCALQIGLDEYLCASAGFYYRMGTWVGEPHVDNGVLRARQLCFPKELQQILAEYRGELEIPSTKESAVIHLIDAVISMQEEKRAELGENKWNWELWFYQLTNDLSTSGIYDKSGLSINEFIKTRDMLAREVFH